MNTGVVGTRRPRDFFVRFGTGAGALRRQGRIGRSLPLLLLTLTLLVRRERVREGDVRCGRKSPSSSPSGPSDNSAVSLSPDSLPRSSSDSPVSPGGSMIPEDGGKVHEPRRRAETETCRRTGGQRREVMQVGREEGRNGDTANRNHHPSLSRSRPAVCQSRASSKAAAAVEKQTAVEHRPQYCRSSCYRKRNPQLCRRRRLGKGQATTRP